MTRTVSHYQLLMAWIRTFKFHAREIVPVALICLGCLAYGLVTMQVPKHVTFHRAKVRYVGPRLGSKRPGAMVEVETETGARLFLTTRGYVKGLKKGAYICVNEMRDAIRGRPIFANALPGQCDAVTSPAP